MFVADVQLHLDLLCMPYDTVLSNVFNNFQIQFNGATI